MIVFYLRSFETNPASTAILLYNAASPIMVLVLSMMFAGERLNVGSAAGFLLLLAAGILSSLEFDHKIRFKRTLGWMLLASVFFSVSYVLAKYATDRFTSIAEFTAWQFLGVVMTIQPLYVFCLERMLTHAPSQWRWATSFRESGRVEFKSLLPKIAAFLLLVVGVMAMQGNF